MKKATFVFALALTLALIGFSVASAKTTTKKVAGMTVATIAGKFPLQIPDDALEVCSKSDPDECMYYIPVAKIQKLPLVEYYEKGEGEIFDAQHGYRIKDGNIFVFFGDCDNGECFVKDGEYILKLLFF